MAYNGTIDLISGIRQKNSGTFPLVDANAVRVDDSTRLDAALQPIVKNVDELPTASSENHLWMRAVNTGGTEQVYINILVDGTYTWKKLGSISEGGTSSSTARLGTAVLGTMILGKE